jgi:hypothetical protein
VTHHHYLFKVEQSLDMRMLSMLEVDLHSVGKHRITSGTRLYRHAIRCLPEQVEQSRHSRVIYICSWFDLGVLLNVVSVVLMLGPTTVPHLVLILILQDITLVSVLCSYYLIEIYSDIKNHWRAKLPVLENLFSS